MRGAGACGLMAVVLCAAVTCIARAEEPAREFLNQLRAAGYYDVALDYLDDVSPRAPAAERQTLRFERGTTLLDAARANRDATARDKQLNDAEKTLQGFLVDNPSHALAMTAQKEIGNVLVTRAKVAAERAKKSKDAADQQQAVALYDAAAKSFGGTHKTVAEQLKKIPPIVDEKDIKLQQLQEQLRKDLAHLQSLLAAIHEESAEVYEPGSKPYQERMLAAAKAYGEIFDQYRTRVAGFAARMYQGRCYQKIGNHQEALSYFKELLDEPDSVDDVRNIKTLVLTLAIKSWSHDSQKRHAEAIEKGNAWLEKVRPAESKRSDWLRLRLELARTLQASAEQLKAKDPKQAMAQLKEARKLAEFVVKINGDTQKEARQLLTELGIAPVAESTEPKNFAEAIVVAKEAFDAFVAAQQLTANLPAKIAAATDAEKAELQKQLTEAQAALPKHRAVAETTSRAALNMAESTTTSNDLSMVRFQLCYLALVADDYQGAALMGEFVARHDPSSPAAKYCAQYAMRARIKLFALLQQEGRAKGLTNAEIMQSAADESQQVIAICEYISTQWANDPLAIEAINTLIPFIVSTGELTKAEAYLAKIPADSPHRGPAELTTGQALWSEYVRGMRQWREWDRDGVPEGQSLAKRKRDLTEMKQRAQQTLESGVTRMKQKKETTSTFAEAILSLSQIYVDTNQPAKAIAELEEPNMGPLALARKKESIVTRTSYADDTLKVALRSYIGALVAADKATAEALLKKARGIMDELKARAGEDAAAQGKLVRIYLEIATDLKRQLEEAETAEAKSNLSQGFETFLDQVGREATEFNVLNWVADTFYKMAEALESGATGPATPAARQYYTKANAQLEQILARGAKEKDFFDPKFATQLQIRTANCKRKLGDYAGSIADFERILKARPNDVSIQIEAALTFQECGRVVKDPKYYFRAIMGGENKLSGSQDAIIWGWGKLQRVTANNAAFRDTFFQARYNIAVCRYQMALLEKLPAKRKEQMEAAERDIRNVWIFDKQYGGETWRGRFDILVRQVQRELKRKTEGLTALEAEVKVPGGS